MKHKIMKNFNLKLLSLFLAFLIWLVVGNANNPIRSRLFSDVKIQVINEDSVTEIDKVFDIISEETVVLKVTERRSVLNSLIKDDFTVIADMENLNGMDSVPLTVSCSNPYVSWDEIEITPSSMKVKLEQRKQSEFAVNVSVEGEPEKGYEVGRTEIVQGKSVLVAGAESLMNSISQITAVVRVSHINTDQRITAALKIIDKNGNEFTDAQMSRIQIKDINGVLLSENSVMVDVALWKLMKDIPVNISVTGNLASGYRLASVSALPGTVNLVGTKEALADLNGSIAISEPVSIEGKTESFTKDIDITETLAAFEGIRLAADSDPIITVSVQVEKAGDRTIMVPLSKLEVSNKPSGMSLAFSPADELAVQVRSAEEIDELTVDDIEASVDLSVCAKPGIYDIPVEIKLPEGCELVAEVKLVVTAEENLKTTDIEEEEEP